MSSIAVLLAHHVLQSTLFALAAGGLTVLLRANAARVRYLLWLAASVKFLVPFALLTTLGLQIPWRPAPLAILEGMLFMRIGAQGATMPAPAIHTAGEGSLILIGLVTLWVVGMWVLAVRWFIRWRAIRRALSVSTPTSLSFAIPVRVTRAQFEPGVVGVVWPVLLLPAGLDQRLTPAEMRAVLAHEACHVRWRDNLAAALHMLVEVLFWWHPLVWWLGTRIVDERERACDEQVLAAGHPPYSYAEGILKVCDHYLGYALPCVAGISGADIRQRIENIMENREIMKLNAARSLMLALAACAALAVPVMAGVFTPRHALAQEAAVPTALMRISFQDAGIDQVAAAVTRATGKRFVIDPPVQGQVSFYHPEPMSPAQFYEAFVTLLKDRHFTAVAQGDVISIVPEADDFVRLPAWSVQHGPLSFGNQSNVQFSADTASTQKDGSVFLKGHVHIHSAWGTVNADKAVITRDPDGGIIVSLNAPVAIP